MRRIFIDDEHESTFSRQGYIVVPFISEETVNELLEHFHNSLRRSGGQMNSQDTGIGESPEITYDFTFIDKNPEYKREVFHTISKTFEKPMSGILKDYRPIIANYIRKTPGGGEVPLHENWAFADEKKCTTVSIWCPLVDSNATNGTLQVVPGSHKRFGEYRGPKIPWELENIQQSIIENELMPLEIPKGYCVILDDSIVHYSSPNHSQLLRLAIQLICIPSEFPSLHYHMESQTEGSSILQLEVDDDFYMEFNPWKAIENPKILKRIPYKPKSLSYSEFKERLTKPAFDQKMSIWNRLKIAFDRG
jgi:hypothetical protein